MKARWPHLVALLSTAVILAVEEWIRTSGGFILARGSLLTALAIWIVASLTLTSAVLHLQWRHAAVLVLALTALFQVVALRAGPQLSNDLYRYTWDAKVASAGVDPYLYPPEAPQLARLREPYLWPGPAACATPRSSQPKASRADPFARERPPGCTPINRSDVRTLYPPAAEAWFRLARWVTPNNARELQVQIPAAVSAVALTGMLLLGLRRTRGAPAWALLFGAGPLAGLETSMDGHVDAVAALLVIGAVLLLVQGRLTLLTRAAGLGVLVSLAALVKLYPGLLLVPLLPLLPGWRSRAVACGAGFVTALALYAPHLVATDGRVLGYLPGYLNENGYNSGRRFLLLTELGLGSHTIDLAAVLLVVATVAAVCLPVHLDGLLPHEVGVAWCQRSAAFFGTVFLIVTPGNAWYCTLLAAVAVIAVRPEWVLVVLANYCVYFDALLKWHGPLPRTSYVAATVVVVAAALARRRGPTRH